MEKSKRIKAILITADGCTKRITLSKPERFIYRSIISPLKVCTDEGYLGQVFTIKKRTYGYAGYDKNQVLRYCEMVDEI